MNTPRVERKQAFLSFHPLEWVLNSWKVGYCTWLLYWYRVSAHGTVWVNFRSIFVTTFTGWFILCHSGAFFRRENENRDKCHRQLQQLFRKSDKEKYYLTFCEETRKIDAWPDDLYKSEILFWREEISRKEWNWSDIMFKNFFIFLCINLLFDCLFGLVLDL